VRGGIIGSGGVLVRGDGLPVGVAAGHLRGKPGDPQCGDDADESERRVAVIHLQVVLLAGLGA